MQGDNAGVRSSQHCQWYLVLNTSRNGDRYTPGKMKFLIHLTCKHKDGCWFKEGSVYKEKSCTANLEIHLCKFTRNILCDIMYVVWFTGESGVTKFILLNRRITSKYLNTKTIHLPSNHYKLGSIVFSQRDEQFYHPRMNEGE